MQTKREHIHVQNPDQTDLGIIYSEYLNLTPAFILFWYAYNLVCVMCVYSQMVNLNIVRICNTLVWINVPVV